MKLLKDRDVAEMLGVSRRFVWKLNATREMPGPVRIGRSVRWRSDVIEAWIEAGCPGGAALERLVAAAGEGGRR